ncbi:MAG: hypothetical protein LBM74_04540 [Oscillospiraceae bacterium]|jgi:hypothetical protein|nr:hypothetical protein [Oscillospiraceae bacterium]
MMKRVLLVGLVGLLALCAFGGAAVAEPYDIEELGLTFELPEGWVAVTEGDAAYSGIDRLEEIIREDPTLAEAVVHFAAVSTGTPTAGIAWLELAESPVPSLDSYRWAPDEIIETTLQRLPNSTAVRGRDSVFFVQTSDIWMDTKITAFTQEQYKPLLCIGVGFRWAEAALSSAMDTVLTSSAFTPPTMPIDPEAVVNDPVAWCNAFETLLAQSGYSVLARTAPVVREDGTYTITDYRSKHTMIRLLGNTPDKIGEVSVFSLSPAEVPHNHTHESALSAAELDFVYLSALSMAASLSQSPTQADLTANIALVHNALRDIAAIDHPTAILQYFPWHGLKLGVYYVPFDGDLQLATVVHY